MTKFHVVHTTVEPVLYAAGTTDLRWVEDRDEAGLYTIWRALQICGVEQANGMICVYEEEYSLADKLAEMATLYQWRHDGEGYSE